MTKALHECKFMSEDDFSYLLDESKWIRRLSYRVTPEEMKERVIPVVKTLLIDLETQPNKLDLIIEKVFSRGAEHTYLIEVKLADLDFNQRKEIEACFVASIIRYLILETPLEKRDTTQAREEFRKRLLEEGVENSYADFMQNELGSDTELTSLYRFERAVLIAKKYISGNRNQGLFVSVGSLLEGSDDFTKYVTGGHASKETTRRLMIIRRLCGIQPRKRMRKLAPDIPKVQKESVETEVKEEETGLNQNEENVASLSEIALTRGSNVSSYGAPIVADITGVGVVGWNGVGMPPAVAGLGIYHMPSMTPVWQSINPNFPNMSHVASPFGHPPLPVMYSLPPIPGLGSSVPRKIDVPQSESSSFIAYQGSQSLPSSQFVVEEKEKNEESISREVTETECKKRTYSDFQSDAPAYNSDDEIPALTDPLDNPSQEMTSIDVTVKELLQKLQNMKECYLKYVEYQNAIDNENLDRAEQLSVQLNTIDNLVYTSVVADPNRFKAIYSSLMESLNNAMASWKEVVRRTPMLFEQYKIDLTLKKNLNEFWETLL